MTYRHDMLPFTSSWTPVCPQQETAAERLKHTNNKSDLFLISNFRRVLNDVFCGKSDLTCFIWTKKENTSECIMVAAAEDSLFDTRECQRGFFLQNYIFVLEPNRPHIQQAENGSCFPGNKAIVSNS
jgi:hypothetical protein